MTTVRRTALLAVTAALAMSTGACGNDGAGNEKNETTTDACFADGEGFGGEARVYIEHNATDEDTGFHGMFDQEGLTKGCLTTPDGRELLLPTTSGPLADLGINQFFFESREPPNDEYSVEDLKADFPEGEYRISGIDFEGKRRVATATFTHAVPKPPDITEPRLVEEEQAGSNVLPPSGVTVRWDPVTETIDGRSVVITGYEVIVTQVQHRDPDGLSRPVYDVHVSPDVTTLPVAEGFLRPRTVYELEVLALEESGNQTIVVGFFATS